MKAEYLMLQRLKIKAVSLVERLALSCGFIVMSRSRFNNGGNALARALTMLVRNDLTERNEGAKGIVFSKDRPLQLHGLLSSYFELGVHTPPLLVIYAASKPEFASAYAEVEELFLSRKVIFVKEQGFRATLLSVLEGLGCSKVFFLVDDILFIRETDFSEFLDFESTNEVTSLRLGTHLNYCYTTFSKQRLPLLQVSGMSSSGAAMLKWRWEEGEYDWGYPLSLDGNCFRTDEMLAMCRLLDFQAPNSFEAALQWFNGAYRGRNGICFEQARIVNIPFNLVQAEVDNRAGSISPESLLRYWNLGYEIDTARYRNVITRSAHQAIELHLKKRQEKKW